MRTIFIAMFSMFSAEIAVAQSDQDWKSCSAEDANDALLACTRLMETQKIDPKERSNALSSRAAAYLRKRDYDRAVADADKAIGLNPKNADAYMRRGAAYAAQEDYERSFADSSKAIEMDPGNFKAYSNRSILHARQHEYERAITDATTAIEINPKFHKPYIVRANTYLRMGDFDRAIYDATAAIEIDPNSADAYGIRGYARFRKSEYNLAIADATKAIEINPILAHGYVYRGAAYEQKGDHDRGVADYNMAIQLDPKQIAAVSERIGDEAGRGNYDRAIVDATTLRAGAYGRKGDYHLAIADYTKLSEIEPTNFGYVRELGLLRFVVGDLEGASADLSRALQLRYDVHAVLFRYLARARAGESEAEVELAENARHLKVKVWPYAFIELFLGKRDADAMLGAAVKRSDRCLAHFYVGQWRALNGNPSDAIADFSAAAEICSKDSVEYRAATAELARRKS